MGLHATILGQLTTQQATIANLEARCDELEGTFWCGGKVNGSNLQVLSSFGSATFTITRASGFGTGVYKITFNQTHPDGAHYVVNLTTQASVSIKVWDSPNNLPTVNHFHIATYNRGSVHNATFPFSVRL